MNFLAHIYLSGSNEDLMIGNFIADAIKGKDFNLLPEGIQKGVILHREIDTFTDNHPIFRQSKRRVSSEFGLYSGVLIDMYYDHFLAKNWDQYHELKLEDFVDEVYVILATRKNELPDFARFVSEKMIYHNWLCAYKDLEKMRDILFQMSKRINFKKNLHESMPLLKSQYQEFEDDFNVFMDEMIKKHLLI